MTEKDQLTTTIIYLLKKENEALRSVVSEFEEEKTCYTQYVVANILQEARETLESKL